MTTSTFTDDKDIPLRTEGTISTLKKKNLEQIQKLIPSKKHQMIRSDPPHDANTKIPKTCSFL